MALRFPTNTASLSGRDLGRGLNKVPFLMELSYRQYSNNASVRASDFAGGQKIILPQPTEGFGNSIKHAYNQRPAKEESTLVKLFSGEASSVLRDGVNYLGKQFQDFLTTKTGIDYGRIPADMSESTYSGSVKRQYTFSWELVALTREDAEAALEIADALQVFSLPGARPSSDRAEAPFIWKIKVLPGNGASSSDLTRIMLGSPKALVLTSCEINRDISVLYGGEEGYPIPFTTSFKLDFQEIEPTYRTQSGGIQSRSETRIQGPG